MVGRDQEVGMKIDRLTEQQAKVLLPQLTALLQDAVDSGASLGFLPPLAPEVAEDYWAGVLREMAQGARILLVATEAGEIMGAAQLELANRQNALHRAEVQKLFVHRRFRSRGIARLLMSAVEGAAREAGRTLLVLDTQRGSVAERLYAKYGYTRVGIIPQYARSADGMLHDTVLFYRLL
jgi:GNAT superfamily N-acetyltransferase